MRSAGRRSAVGIEFRQALDYRLVESIVAGSIGKQFDTIGV